MHVPVLNQRRACCHGAAAFDKRRRSRRIAAVRYFLSVFLARIDIRLARKRIFSAGE
jgi:hypothetical protein